MFSLHPSLYFFLQFLSQLFLMSSLVPDEISMEDPLCNSSFGSMVTLDYVTPDTAFAMFHPAHKEMCFKFHKGQCMDAAVCGRKHSCVGCGAEGKPYNFCHCLQSKLN